MKTIAAFLCLVVSASLAHAQVTPAVKPTDSKTTPVKPADPKVVLEKPADPKTVAKDAKTAAKDPKAPADKKDPKKEPPLPKIPGTVIDRPNGTFLSLQVAGGNFTLTFYDKKHKPMAMDVTRATARWPNPRSPGDNRTVLNGSGTTLVGAKPVIPPFNFSVSLTLLKGDGDEAKAVENYTVPFRG